MRVAYIIEYGVLYLMPLRILILVHTTREKYAKALLYIFDHFFFNNGIVQKHSSNAMEYPICTFASYAHMHCVFEYLRTRATRRTKE